MGGVTSKNSELVPEQEQAPDWQLVAEFALSDRASNQQALAGQVIEAGQRLRIQPEQLERIRTIMARALMRATENGRASEHPPTVHFRIWSSLPFRADCGWGFFLVDKHSSTPAPVKGEDGHLLELFLYRVCPRD
jgi:hypothetical protein